MLSWNRAIIRNQSLQTSNYIILLKTKAIYAQNSSLPNFIFYLLLLSVPLRLFHLSYVGGGHTISWRARAHPPLCCLQWHDGGGLKLAMVGTRIPGIMWDQKRNKPPNPLGVYNLTELSWKSVCVGNLAQSSAQRQERQNSALSSETSNGTVGRPLVSGSQGFLSVEVLWDSELHKGRNCA